MKRTIKFIIFSFVITLPLLFLGTRYISSTLPDVYYINSKDNQNFSLYPFSISYSDNVLTKHVNATVNQLKHSDSYSANLKFMNIFPIKKVEVRVTDNQYVVPCGIPFGVKLYTKGALVIGTSSVKSYEGIIEPWKDAGIKKGDIIFSVNGKEVVNNDDLENIIQDSDGSDMEFNVIRNNTEFNTVLKPLKSIEDNKYRIGIWVRDSSAGIGTLTFCNRKNKTFAGLGHGICDVDTSELMSVSRGDIVEAVITDIVKGCRGIPGELKGCFTDPQAIGHIYANNETGLYGNIENIYSQLDEIPIAMKQNVKRGPAQILTTIEGKEPKLYDINIDSINYDVRMPTKNMKISVVDPILLEKTGGIVQGMSGSPIIQNGRLVGAVTHVFINNPSKGYAIFSETMLTNSNVIFEEEYNNFNKN